MICLQLLPITVVSRFDGLLQFGVLVLLHGTHTRDDSTQWTFANQQDFLWQSPLNQTGHHCKTQPVLYVPGPDTIGVFFTCFYCVLEHGRVQMPQPPAVDLFGQTLARSFPLRFQHPLPYPKFYTLSWISFQRLVSVLFSCSSKLSWKSSLSVRI